MHTNIRFFGGGVIIWLARHLLPSSGKWFDGRTSCCDVDEHDEANRILRASSDEI